MGDRTPQDDVNAASRRCFLLGSLGLLLTGCAKTDQLIGSLPGPAWDMQPAPAGTPSRPHPTNVPAPPVPSWSKGSGYMPRQLWAKGHPVPALMNRMLPIRYITVHHDGMKPFYGAGAQSAAARLEMIRRSHRESSWGDIGYHFAVDRAGNVWECRPIGWQGAHVGDHNEGNIGIVALGNFDTQAPTAAQLEGVRRHISALMRAYRIPVARVRTHQEWAPTRCPGQNLQRYMESARSRGVFS